MRNLKVDRSENCFRQQWFEKNNLISALEKSVPSKQ
jgi:hypothetical protein